ncbi:damage-inducible protein CinA [Vibrio metoecus]|uniref:Damage-inducible protein CinA n=1 Tax=Vibrio metoecus TaxID=1481663 RepID=A0A067BLN5_VIBMT|nr:nicotinamide-nucleotide amidase [Vibrio metoecus]KDO15291.1 damage-inducible protein CinA [Vibrio metoecus]KQA16300.1 damage-inducible protein CinA [Vibrio metoecus]KQA23540.1 damage-inducible protein CinA [Vibrio metoecus]KQA98366.1 damage-inducible protein CinA [Vibrio metoecus]MCR9387461.1 nicotinamide-nucleotide amidase [Vibrio metoecus]
MRTPLLMSQQLGLLLAKQQQILTTAESCTGGGVAYWVTEVAGSSAWFDRSFVTYSNEAKQEMIGVREATLQQFGAVSEQTVEEMALGALLHSRATLAAAISGIAGPGGGSAEKPVGTVCFGFASVQGWLKIETCHFTGDREQVRQQAIEHVLQSLIQHLTLRDAQNVN